MRQGMGVLFGLMLAIFTAVPSPGLGAQLDLELFAPARDAERAILAARRAGAAETAGQDLSLAAHYFEEAKAALQPASGLPNREKATHLFHLAEGHARLAEARTVEETRDHEAGDAALQFLQAINGAPPGMAPTGPSLSEASASFSRLRREAARARSDRRTAEEKLKELQHEGD
ncbi:MAG TPA: hypothetical protein VLM91_10035 [Candidatus Methylomirabilis sp.]|nr:hypothetical protein [Candidatus Methylomirabilis sp.]